MKGSRKNILAAIAAGVVAGWMAHAQLNPPTDRPVLSAIAKVIRNWWWVPLLLDPGPPADSADAPAIVGEDGYPIVQHGRSI